MKLTVIIILIGAQLKVMVILICPQRSGKKTRVTGDQRKNRDHPKTVMLNTVDNFESFDKLTRKKKYF